MMRSAISPLFAINIFLNISLLFKLITHDFVCTKVVTTLSKILNIIYDGSTKNSG